MPFERLKRQLTQRDFEIQAARLQLDREASERLAAQRKEEKEQRKLAELRKNALKKSVAPGLAKDLAKLTGGFIIPREAGELSIAWSDSRRPGAKKPAMGYKYPISVDTSVDIQANEDGSLVIAGQDIPAHLSRNKPVVERALEHGYNIRESTRSSDDTFRTGYYGPEDG